MYDQYIVTTCLDSLTAFAIRLTNLVTLISGAPDVVWGQSRHTIKKGPLFIYGFCNLPKRNVIAQGRLKPAHIAKMPSTR